MLNGSPMVDATTPGGGELGNFFRITPGGSHSDVIYAHDILREIDYIMTFQVGHKHVMDDVEKGFGIRTFCVGPLRSRCTSRSSRRGDIAESGRESAGCVTKKAERA